MTMFTVHLTQLTTKYDLIHHCNLMYTNVGTYITKDIPQYKLL